MSASGARPDGRRRRIGINLGDVMVDGDDIHGDGVNIASRLEAYAAGTAFDGRTGGPGIGPRIKPGDA